MERLYIVEDQIYTPYEALALDLPSPLWQGQEEPPEFIKLFQRDISFKGVDGELISSADTQTPSNPRSPLGKSRLWIDYEESGTTLVEAPVTLTLSFPCLDRAQFMTMTNYYMEFIFPKTSYFMLFNDGNEDIIDQISAARGKRRRVNMEIVTGTFFDHTWEEKNVGFPYERTILAQGIKFRVAKFDDPGNEDIHTSPTPSSERQFVLV